MRIVIDLQSCQSGSRHGGIGRYSMELAKAMAREPRDHELHLLLSAAMPGSIVDIRSAFAGLIPDNRIHVFDIPTPVARRKANRIKVQIAELIREDFLCSLQPDFVHVSSLFEGFSEEVVTSVGRYFPGANTAVTLYDLIPLVQSARYLRDEPSRDYYSDKIANIKRAGLLLAISEYSRLEGIDLLGIDPENVVNISSAADERFQPIEVSPDRANRLRERYGIKRKFLMYTASFDYRKNQKNLILAFALLPVSLRNEYQLVIVGNGSDDALGSLTELGIKAGLGYGEVVFPGHVVDIDLVALYNLCELFVLPSFAEGFGLPALEAMSCGTATIGSNATSLPEVIGWSEALFDPASPSSIAAKIQQALSDEGFLLTLRERGQKQAKNFSWERSAQRAFDAFESHHKRVENYARKEVGHNVVREFPLNGRRDFQVQDGLETLVKKILEVDRVATLTDQDLLEVAEKLADNRSARGARFHEM
jgi:glycosyltransferase involved in cell wall biosynthesis